MNPPGSEQRRARKGQRLCGEGSQNERRSFRAGEGAEGCSALPVARWGEDTASCSALGR